MQRGEYVFRAAGGCSCHTDAANKGAFMAGGRPIKTPFGNIYSTNITPAPNTGIGKWSDADFLKAMTGRGRTAPSIFPFFPIRPSQMMTQQDLLDLKAYLFSIPPWSTRINRSVCACRSAGALTSASGNGCTFSLGHFSQTLHNRPSGTGERISPRPWATAANVIHRGIYSAALRRIWITQGPSMDLKGNWHPILRPIPRQVSVRGALQMSRGCCRQALSPMVMTRKA